MRRPLDIDISDLAKTQIRVAEDWWRLNRTKAPNAIREELERAVSIIAIQPEAGARALNVSLARRPGFEQARSREAVRSADKVPDRMRQTSYRR